MQNKSLHTNIFLNIVKQLCILIFPLVTVPYASRTLLQEKYGMISFGSSIVSYFSLIASLGISTYAIREGCAIRENKKEFNNFACQIFTINILSTSISYILFFVTIMWNVKLFNMRSLLFIQGLSILFTTIGTDWVNTVYEEFLYITLRFVIFQCIAVLLMLVFVKEPEDYLIYAYINLFATAGPNVLNMLYCKKFVHIKLVKVRKIKDHIAPVLVLFANTIATTIYINSDITILGFVQDNSAVGIYSLVGKIYTMAKQLVSAFIVAITPRLASYIGNQDLKKYTELLSIGFEYLITLLVPIALGIAILSRKLIIIIGGEAYVKGSTALVMLSIAMLFAIPAFFISSSMLILMRKERLFLYVTIAGAVINISANFFAIPNYSYNGAAFTTLLAEAVVLFMTLIFTKGTVRLRCSKRSIISVMVAGFIMGICCQIVLYWNKSLYSSVIMSVCVGVLAYVVILWLFKNRVLLDLVGKNDFKKGKSVDV
ncbi:flippase [Otoolea muris]|uniref:flippase n=1 Tax=Otoolea muris TaxID=2941515 RepID=UPI0020413E8F|nr:flippase [Otoolea muris]